MRGGQGVGGLRAVVQDPLDRQAAGVLVENGSQVAAAYELQHQEGEGRLDAVARLLVLAEVVDGGDVAMVEARGRPALTPEARQSRVVQAVVAQQAGPQQLQPVAAGQFRTGSHLPPPRPGSGEPS
ncbi:hypothetical protein ACGFI3_31360 [Nonomuraea wenchangensis]|uniref:hypothetical protein n=1 Tax=Nonomuraea wenchangensis TaxID=568860 RepID=UPI003711AC4A